MRPELTGTPQTENNPRRDTGGVPTSRQSLTRTRSEATEKEARDVFIVRPAAVNASVLASTVRRRGGLPQANASLYEPSGQRSWWWISMRCPHCGSVHLGRVRNESEAPGPRRAGCGRRVFVRIRSVYRSYESRRSA